MPIFTKQNLQFLTNYLAFIYKTTISKKMFTTVLPMFKKKGKTFLKYVFSS